MSETNNTANLRLWFRNCPVISKSNKFNVDYLSGKATEYSLYAVPSTLKYHENILGDNVLDDIQTVNYIFASREIYGADARQNIQNLGFYQSIVDWITEQNNSQNFPEWDGGSIKSIVPTLTAYVAQAGSDAAKYQIQIQVKYRRK